MRPRPVPPLWPGAKFSLTPVAETPICKPSAGSDPADSGHHPFTGTENVTVRRNIEAKIRAALSPMHLRVIDESHMHAVPPGSESHFKLVVVSDRFEGVSRIRRHQTVNRILEQELREDIHALSMETLTAAEWERKGAQTTESPPCLGGTKADK